MSEHRRITSINSYKLGDDFEYRGATYKITSFPDEVTAFGVKVLDKVLLDPRPDTVRILIMEL